MVQPNAPLVRPLKDVSKAASNAVRKSAESFEQTLRDIPVGVVSTARIIISAEELLRQRLRSVLRVTVATLFLGISGLISLGANVTMAFAKKVSPETTRVKKTRGTLKTRYRLHNGDTRLGHERSSNEHASSKMNLSSKMQASSKMHQWAVRHGKHQLHGVASWYGGKFQHRKTASGVRFETHAMMAAHRTLPFGTKVRVTNIRNHKSCIVEITDRGPYSHGRVIDLSYAAAQRIDMTHSGTAEVAIEPIGMDLLDIAYENKLETTIKADSVLDRIPTFPLRELDSVLSSADLTKENEGD